MLYCFLFNFIFVMRLCFYLTIPEAIHRMSRFAPKSSHIPSCGPRRNMNCSLANLMEAIGVVEFLVVASRSMMISMLTRFEFSHLTQSLTMFYDFFITFTSTCIECFSLQVPFYRLHHEQKAWKLRRDLDRRFEIARYSAQMALCNQSRTFMPPLLSAK